MPNSIVRVHGQRLRLRFGVLSTALLVGLILASYGRADFVAPYAPSAFTLTNSAFANGTLDDSGAPNSIVLTGPNDGSGLGGSTQLTIKIPGNGVVRFKYLYNTLDVADMDSAGYILNGQYLKLGSKDGQSGTVNVQVHVGDTFGFQVDTVDNTGEPGVLTISDFAAPGAAPVPATSYPAAIALAALLCLSSLRFIRRGAYR